MLCKADGRRLATQPAGVLTNHSAPAGAQPRGRCQVLHMPPCLCHAMTERCKLCTEKLRS
jgi:hypothetical protein